MNSLTRMYTFCEYKNKKTDMRQDLVRSHLSLLDVVDVSDMMDIGSALSCTRKATTTYLQQISPVKNHHF